MTKALSSASDNLLKRLEKLPLSDILLKTPAEMTEEDKEILTLFTEYLLNTFRSKQFTIFASQLDPNHINSATKAAFNISFSDLQANWLDSLAEVEPTTVGSIKFLHRILKYFTKYKGIVVTISFALSIQILYAVLLPLAYKEITDDVIVNKDVAYLGTILMLIGIGFLLKLSAGSLSDYLRSILGVNISNDIRLKLFKKIQRVSPTFYQKHSGTEIVGRFSSDCSAVEGAVVRFIPNAVKNTIIGILSLILLFTIEWHLALFTVLALPMTILPSRPFTPIAAKLGPRRKKHESALSRTVLEDVGMYLVTRIFSLQKERMKLFKKRLNNVKRYSVKDNLIVELVGRSTVLGFDFLTLIIIGLGAYMAIHETLTVGSLIGFLAYFRNVSGSIEKFAMSLPTLIRASGAMQRIQNVLSVKSAIKKTKETVTIPGIRSEIKFNHVDFSYEGAEKVCNDINLAVKAGQSVAIVGASGSGKSTILSLLMHLYDPDNGSISIDGHDIRKASELSLRNQIGVILQDSLLYNTTIHENIRMGKLNATNEEIINAAKSAEIHDMITEFPQQYETIVGAFGSRLSQGQRQRVAIARTLMREPKILLLDEATMSLDPGTETAINQTLEKIKNHRTIISVTHRLSSVLDMDKIFVIDHGTLIEEGTHEELVSQQGVYSKLWEKQSGVIVSADGLTAEVKPSLLQAIPLLKSLDEKTLKMLSDRFVLERVDANQTVFEEGVVGDKFYIIAHGRVEVLKQDITGFKKSVAVLDDGDYFGEIALIENVPRTAEIHTRVPCIFLSLQSNQFNDLLNAVPELKEDFEKTVAARRKELREMFRD